jgi:hypothetical protein
VQCDNTALFASKTDVEQRLPSPSKYVPDGASGTALWTQKPSLYGDRDGDKPSWAQEAVPNLSPDENELFNSGENDMG